MVSGRNALSAFYLKYLGGKPGDRLTVDCPFCEQRGFPPGKLQVILKNDSFFHGYFRCLNRCVQGGFASWFASLMSLPPAEVPGIDQEDDAYAVQHEFPVKNINDEIGDFCRGLEGESLEWFGRKGVGAGLLRQMKIGFNGRYLVFPYLQNDGNSYSARCVHPEKKDDFFWYGDSKYSSSPFSIYNVQELKRCYGGTAFLCVGEPSLLVLKQLGFPGLAVSHYSQLEELSVDLFKNLHTLFIITENNLESFNGARNLAARVGHKVRILQWPAGTARDFSLWKAAGEHGKELGPMVGEMIKNSSSFSPFTQPAREYRFFLQSLQDRHTEAYKSLTSGFEAFDEALGGLHGINVIGGAPKVGKSTFMIQIGAHLALKKIPVLYYDFENGRRKIYLRTLCRMARLTGEQISQGSLTDSEKQRLEGAQENLEMMLSYWRVINDRKITPDIMRKHIDFIRHEARSEYTVVVIDSLHKLPFHGFGEQRSGIDAWLRQMESIRDGLHVSFLVISELTRGSGGIYETEPHLGIFKGSGDIEYSADNAMVLIPAEPPGKDIQSRRRENSLWLVASREHSPGKIANYCLDYPYWGFCES